MRIGWCYLDKRDAAIRALKDYDSMKFIIDHTDENIKSVSDQMTSISSPGFEEHIRADNPKAGEDKLIKMIDEIDTLKERYRQAVEYMDWFEPAWNSSARKNSISWKLRIRQRLQERKSVAIFFLRKRLIIRQRIEH